VPPKLVLLVGNTVRVCGRSFVMVQLYYYENRGRCARKLLRHDGYSGSTPGTSKTRVLLFPCPRMGSMHQ